MPGCRAPIVSAETVAEYRKNGAVVLRNVFDSRWVQTVKEGIDENMANPSPFSESLKGDKGTGAYFDDYFNWSKIPQFKDYVYNSPAAQIAAELMESKETVFYHEHVLVKEPWTTKETPWHHDQPYYPIDGDKVCSVWMPVDPIPKETCVQFVAGSHKGDKWYIPRKFANSVNYQIERQVTSRKYHDVPDIDSGGKDILQWELQPGDCIVFHMRTLHGAPGNASKTTSRRVLSTRWLGDDATMAERPWETSPPVMGGLMPGDRAHSETFPLIYTNN